MKRTASPAKSCNRSLKSELIFTNTSHSSGRDYQIPGCRKDLGIAESLPEFDVEIASSVFSTHQAGHHQTIVHLPYYPSFASGAGAPRGSLVDGRDVCSSDLRIRCRNRVQRLLDAPGGSSPDDCPSPLLSILCQWCRSPTGLIPKPGRHRKTVVQ